MDLLSQYKQDHPEAFQKKKPLPLTDEYGRAYTGMIALVMRLSGGRIRDVNAAIRILLTVAGIIIFTAIAMAFFTLRDTRPSPSAADLRLTPPSAPVR